MPVIAIVNQKGGVGKTTTAVTLAHFLSQQGGVAILVDLDPQGHCATSLGMKKSQGVYDLFVREVPPKDIIKPTGRRNLYILRGDKRTAEASTILGVQNAEISRLRNIFAPWLRREKNLYIVIDTAPSVGNVQIQGLYAADFVLIPTSCDFLSVASVKETLATLSDMGKMYGWGGKLLGILPTFYDSQTKETKEQMKALHKSWPGLVLEPINRATIIRGASGETKTIFELLEDAPVCQQYTNLCVDILKATRK